MNRRKFPRVKPHPAAAVDVQVMGDGFLEIRRAKDISEGGIGITVPHRFEGIDIAGEVRLVIKIGGNKAFSAKGVIRFVSLDQGYFGIEFLELPADAKILLHDYVKIRMAEGGLV